MSIFLTNEELANICAAKNQDTQLGALWHALKTRTYANTAEDTLVQSSDTQLWWHLVWERIRDAASVYAIEPNKKLGKWTHDRVMEIVHLPADEWIGPLFRKRQDPPRGELETAHVTNAVAEAYDLCPHLFSAEEKDEILKALRERALPFCREYLQTTYHSNWCCVLAGGFATAAVILGDKNAIEESVGYYQKCTEFYDEDGYGETLQYGNYASLSLSHMYDVLVRFDPSLAERINIECIANTIRWTVSSFLYMKPLGGDHGNTLYPRSLNFGDSAAIFRPTGEVLLQVSALCKDKTVAGLARWLFDITYSSPADGPDELATFGFYNHFSYVALKYLSISAPPVSPKEANMPLMNIYKTGTATIRSEWSDTATILGTEIGYDKHSVEAHRHYDQNSFILVYDNERYFIDPGHCCYRLKVWKEALGTDHHNTWSFVDQEGNEYKQNRVHANCQPLNKLISYPQTEGFKIISSDCAKAYGEHFKRAERVWITAFPNVMFMIDVIETDIPMKMTSHFIINNRDNKLDSKTVDSSRQVFRRGRGGLKFFTYANEPVELKARYGYIHDYYHPLHNQLGQGKEGSAEIYDYITDFATTHMIIHPIAMSDTNGIRSWHIKKAEENVYKIFNKGNTHSWTLTITPDQKDWFTVSEEDII